MKTKLLLLFATFAMLCAVGCEEQGGGDDVNPNDKTEQPEGGPENEQPGGSGNDQSGDENENNSGGSGNNNPDTPNAPSDPNTPGNDDVEEDENNSGGSGNNNPDTPNTPSDPNTPGNDDVEEDDDSLEFDVDKYVYNVPAEGMDITITLHHDTEPQNVVYFLGDENDNEISWIELIDTRTFTTDIVFRVYKNTSDCERLGLIWLADIEHEVQTYIEVYQQPELRFEVSPLEINVPPVGGGASFALNYNIINPKFSATIPSEYSGWISTPTITATHCSFYISPNNTQNTRTAVLEINEAKSGLKRQVTIIQKSKSQVYLTITPETTEISNYAKYVTFTVSHTASKENISHTIDSSAQSWLSFSSHKDNTYTFFASNNSSTSSRIGKITFMDSENQLQKTVTIYQAAATNQGGGGDDSGNSGIESNNKINYTSYSGLAIDVATPSAFNVNIVSNKYENGKGTIEFDGKLTTVGERAFYENRELTSITLPESVTNIGNAAFYKNSYLTSITFSKNLTSIGSEAFLECIKLSSISTTNNLKTIGDSAFKECDSITSIKLSGITSVGNNAFENCDNLSSITLGSGLNSIGESAFRGCRVLQGIVLPNNISVIKKNTFAFCEALKDITFPSQLVTIEENAFFSCENLNVVDLHNQTKTISSSAFYKCNIQSLMIPSSVTDMQQSAFHNCKINKLILNAETPDYSTWNTPFFNVSVDVFIVGDNVSRIGAYLFAGSSTVTIGSNVKSIGNYAFSSLEALYCKPTTPPSLQYTPQISENFKLYVPKSAVAAYSDDSMENLSKNLYWTVLAKYIVGYDF